MKIVHYHAELSLAHGGVVRAVLDLAGALTSAGHDVTVISSPGADVPEAWRAGAAGTPCFVEIDAPVAPGGRLTRRALRIIDTHLAGADVLHLHGLWRFHHLQLAARASRRDLPYVISAHGMLDDWSVSQRNGLKRMYLAIGGRRALERAAAVHCAATMELEQARPHFPRGHGKVVPLLLDLTPFRSLPGPGPARTRFPALDTELPTLLFLSRVHPVKGLHRLIEAVDSLRSEGRPCRALVAGGGDEQYVREINATIAERGLTEHVILLGFVSGVEKISLYEAADLFVLPTSQENFGFVLFEALAAQTPVVTTNEADTWPELEQSGGAIIVPADAEAITDAVRPLLDDADRRCTMGRAGRAWIMEHMAEDRVVSAYERLYAGAASQASPPVASPARAPGADE